MLMFSMFCICSLCSFFWFLETSQFRKIVLTRRQYQDLHIFTCYIAICEHTRMMMFVAGLWLSMQIGTGKGIPPRPTFNSYADTTRFSVSLHGKKRHKNRTTIKVKTIYLVTNHLRIICWKEKDNDVIYLLYFTIFYKL